MIDNGYPLRKAMDGGWLPPKEARDIEAALERLEHTMDMVFEDIGVWGDASKRRSPRLWRWFRMQGQ